MSPRSGITRTTTTTTTSSPPHTTFNHSNESPTKQQHNDDDKYTLIRRNLLIWYTDNHRDLPWRELQMEGNHDGNNGEESLPTAEGNDANSHLSPTKQQQHAYKIWISEIMSQQTRIATVIPYYKKWLQKFPTVKSLSEASLEEVNQLWSGLGYYRRAKFLLNGAKYVMEQCNGIIPQTVPQLLKIPGVGKYTAGAIASIAYGKVEPLLDGNVLRLLSRIDALSDDIAQNSVKESVFWPRARKMVSADGGVRPGDLNQSMMELAALVCLPKKPKCNECPIHKHCAAKKQLDLGDIESIDTCYPHKSKKKKKKEATAVACVFERENPQTGKREYFFRKRSEEGLLANLWECPSYDLTSEGSIPGDALDLLLKDLHANHAPVIQALGVSSFKDWNSHQKTHKGTVKHVFTHINQHIDVWHCKLSYTEYSDVKDESSLQWMDSETMKAGALPTMTRKVIKAAEKAGPAPKRIKRKSSTQKQSSNRKQRKITDFTI